MNEHYFEIIDNLLIRSLLQLFDSFNNQYQQQSIGSGKNLSIQIHRRHVSEHLRIY
jgi:hypothetical protein